VHGSSCALDNAVHHILSCDRGTLSDVSCLFDGSRRNRANRDGEGENDRKERFHGTKEFVPAGSCALTRLSSRLRSGSLIQIPQTLSTFSSAGATKRFPSSECASATNVVRTFSGVRHPCVVVFSWIASGACSSAVRAGDL
jgi:hypothetical protein